MSRAGNAAADEGDLRHGVSPVIHEVLDLVERLEQLPLDELSDFVDQLEANREASNGLHIDEIVPEDLRNVMLHSAANAIMALAIHDRRTGRVQP